VVDRLARTFGLSLLVVSAMTIALAATRDDTAAVTFIEARRPTAEHGVRQVKVRTAEKVPALRLVYDAATAPNKGGLDATAAAEHLASRLRWRSRNEVQ
jgi:hypothetical protein